MRSRPPSQNAKAPSLSEARNLRETSRSEIRQGAFIEPPNRIGFEDARSEFLDDCATASR